MEPNKNVQNVTDININVDYYREIYNEWDFSPLNKSDLDDDLFEYLEESASEISKKNKICIVFHIPSSIKDAEKEQKSIEGFKSYFNYKIKIHTNKIKTTKKSSLDYGLFGLFLLFLGYLLQRIIPETIFIDFIIEGFFVGGWVLSWELFNTLFFEQAKLKDKIAVLQRLRDAEIQYKTDHTE